MHLMISIISVTTALVLNESEPVTSVSLFWLLRRTTYNRLDAERGAGMSQRTRRPYLREDVRFGCDVGAITEGTTCVRRSRVRYRCACG